MKFSTTTCRRHTSAILALMFSGFAFAANYPLELVSPRAAGSSPSSDAGSPPIPAGHRIFSAYPGIPYNIRAVVIAGAYPYTFSLSNAPSGMTIDSNTGEINWPNPQANATPTITVTDSEGTTRTSPWTITVTANGFRFVDSARGSDSNAGTLTAPWATLSRVKAASSTGDIIYFRTGVYTTVGMSTESTADSDFNPPGNWQRVAMNGAVRWLAYPGESPVYDGGYIANQRQGSALAVQGTQAYPLYFEGFTLRNMYHIGVQFGSGSSDYPVWRNLTFNGPTLGFEGANSSGIMTTSALTDPTYYGAFQRIVQTSAHPGAMKMYSHKKNLWEDCQIRDTNGGPDQKMHVPRFEVRRCVITNTTSTEQGGLFGNMQFGSGGVGETSSGEFRFNLVDRRNVGMSAIALDLNQNADSGLMYVYRNTFIGRVRVRNADAVQGPFRIYNNVIINSDPGYIYWGNTDGVASSRVTVTDNLTGGTSSNIVDANGQLTTQYQQYVGTRGHQIGNERRPRPPTGVAAQ